MLKNIIFKLAFSMFVALNLNAAWAVSLPQAGYVSQFGVAKDSATPAKTIPGNSLSSVFALHCGKNTATAGNYYRLVKEGAGTAGANYQVTSGKTLYCSGFWYNANTAAFGAEFGYGTAAVTDDNSTAPAGNVYFAGTDASGATIDLAVSAGVQSWIPIPMSFPSQSYPYCRVSQSYLIMFTFLCEEQ